MVKKNLHMSLCFSPVGDDFRRRATQFPAVVNNTVIDWFHPWPQDALTDVATKFLLDLDLGDDEVREGVIKFMPFSFGVVEEYSKIAKQQERKYIYTTPKSFLELIKLYSGMLGQKKDALVQKRDRYDQGLMKLQDTAEQVDGLQEQLVIKQVEVDKKKKSAEEFAAVVTVEKNKV